MNTVSLKINKKNNSVKIFLAVFLFVFLFVGLFGTNANHTQAADNTNSQTAVPANAQKPDEFSCGAVGWVESPLICLAQSLFGVMTVLVSLSVTLFVWAVDPARMTAIISSDSVYLGWKNVRDFLNVAFILFLLFSAFCTIFQIQKYSYKSTLLNLVLMALLVNFSFPIARFIVDVSNVLSYTLLSALFDGNINTVSGSFATISNLGNIVNPGNDRLVPLIIADIFLFIFGVTFLVLGLLFIIRIIALAILIIFSPIAFTGSIIPGLQEKASGWWTQLFNYAFFAPIMIFMIFIATSLAGSMSTELAKTLSKEALKNSNEPDWLANLCSFIIPVVILWMGMMFGKSMAGSVAESAIGLAKKGLLGAGAMAGGAAWWGFKKTGVPGAVKQRWDQSYLSKKSGDARLASREARLADKLGVSGAIEQDMKKRAEEYKKNNVSITELKSKAAKGDLAAAHRLAQDGEMDVASYAAAMGKLDPVKHKSIIDNMNSKIMERQADVIIGHKVNGGMAKDQAYKDVLGGLSPEAFAKQKPLHDKVLTDTNLQNYIVSEVASDTEYHKEFFKKLSRSQRRDYINTGINP